MKIKNFEIEQDFSENMRNGLGWMDAISRDLTGLEIVITSGSEDHAKHMELSKHYKRNNESGKGEAADLRTYIYTPTQIKQIIKEFRLKDVMNKYDLVLESDHFHLEYDPK